MVLIVPAAATANDAAANDADDVDAADAADAPQPPVAVLLLGSLSGRTLLLFLSSVMPSSAT